MVNVVEVKTRKQRKQFVDFPTKLYSGNDYYVHPLRADELALFSAKKNVNFDECDIVFYIAYKDRQVVGRICGIIQKVYNEKHKVKMVRFSRFDCIEDFEVATALISKVEEWAKINGMNAVHGPLGFNDMEREGLLIEGFDQLATFEELYNYPYYKEYLERLGYVKDVDYLSFRIKLPETTDPRVKRIGQMVMKKYGLSIATAKNKKQYLNRYKDKIFDLLDEAYGDLYGMIPYNEKMRKQIIQQFNFFIKLRYIVCIVDKDDNLIAFGFGLPALAKAVQKSKGRLLPLGMFRLLKAVHKNDTADFGLIGVKKEYRGKGIPAIILDYIVENAKVVGVDTIETNHSLEDNLSIIQTWKNFDDVKQHKKYRIFIKDLNKKSKNAKASKTKVAKKTKTKTNTNKKLKSNKTSK